MRCGGQGGRGGDLGRGRHHVLVGAGIASWSGRASRPGRQIGQNRPTLFYANAGTKTVSGAGRGSAVLPALGWFPGLPRAFNKEPQPGKPCTREAGGATAARVEGCRVGNGAAAALLVRLLRVVCRGLRVVKTPLPNVPHFSK
jgi:hypothetical protein